ncbi:MAG: peroxidase-related enzyme [Chitinophagales bacterium]
MSWIKTIDYKDANPKLKKMYDKVKGPNSNIDNVLLAHSLRPHTLTGHMALYKNVLHHSNNTLPKWYLEAIGVYVSFLNKCDYCFQHHFAGFSRLLGDEIQAEKFRKGVEVDCLENCFDDKYWKGFLYAKKLTLHQNTMSQEDIKALGEAGFSDGEILELNQTTSYFNYGNRTVLGLGVNTKGDILGLELDSSDDSNQSFEDSFN